MPLYWSKHQINALSDFVGGPRRLPPTVHAGMAQPRHAATQSSVRIAIGSCHVPGRRGCGRVDLIAVALSGVLAVP